MINNIYTLLTYDVMGNIKTLNRGGLGASTYSYTANQLKISSGNGNFC